MTTAVGVGSGNTAPGTPAGLRGLLLPLVILILGIGGALLVQLVFDPFRTDIPLCVVYHVTGLHCPGCGATRAVHAVIDRDIVLALRNNVLIVVALPAAAISYVLWAVGRVRGRPFVIRPSTRVVLILVAATVIFGIVRNLPAFWFLAPTSLVGA